MSLFCPNCVKYEDQDYFWIENAINSLTRLFYILLLFCVKNPRQLVKIRSGKSRVNVSAHQK